MEDKVEKNHPGSRTTTTKIEIENIEERIRISEDKARKSNI